MNKILYGANGEVKSVIPNLDPNFFIPGTRGNITLGDIASKPYQYHSWINASARTISSNLSRLPRVLVNSDHPEDFIINHPALEVFEKPNIYMPTSIVFWQSIIISLLLSNKSKNRKTGTGGQVFLIPLDKKGGVVNLQRGEIPYTLLPFNDEFITARKNKKGVLVGWTYDPSAVFNVSEAKVKKMDFDLNQVIRIHFYNPYDWLSGMSYFSPAGLAFAEDVRSSVYNSSFFENDATVSGLLSSDQHLTDEQYKQYMKRWYDNYGGMGKGNRTAILGAGLSYQQYGQSHVEMQFIEQKRWNKDQILSNFGLNKIAIGDYEKINYNTILEGRKILWQDTYQPIDIQINKAITDQWIKYIDPKLKFVSDYSGIEQLREDYKSRAESAKLMVEGLKFPPVLAARINDIPLTDENIKKYPWLSEKPFAVPQQNVEPKSIMSIVKAVEKGDATEEERIKLSWDYIHKILDPGEKRFIKQIIRFFTSQRNRMQDKVDRWLASQKKLAKVLNISPKLFLLDKIKENKALVKLYTPLVISQMEAEKVRLQQELGGLIEWDVTDERVNSVIKKRKKMLSKINTTTFKVASKKIGDAIGESVKLNETPQQAAKRIKQAISDVGEERKNQAQTIARTETGIISSGARFDAFNVEGIEYHEWLTAADEKVRSDHMATEMQVVKVGDLFQPVNLLYPLDINGSADQIINCRCVAVAAEKPKS